MKRFIELKHVGPKAHVRHLIEELLDRLEPKLQHIPPDAVSVHVLFEENGTHKLYRTSLTCHVPGRTVAAHEERRDPGEVIREAFAEVERQLDRQSARRRGKPPHKPAARGRRAPRAMREIETLSLVLAACLLAGAAAGWAQEQAGSISPEAQRLIEQLDATDLYDQQKAFMQLEALREPATAAVVRQRLTSRDVDTRVFSVRALAAIEGAAAIPVLLERLRTDRHPRVRIAALLALEPLQAQDAAVMPALIERLRDRKAEVRMAAVDAVSRLDHPEARQAIRLRWRRERHRDVRRVLEHAIARVGGPT